MGWLRNKIKAQFTEHSGTVFKVVEKDGVYYIDSIAGHITYKPKCQKDLDEFRNIWVNRLSINHDRENLAYCYGEIRKRFRVKFRANIITRVKNVYKRSCC